MRLQGIFRPAILAVLLLLASMWAGGSALAAPEVADPLPAFESDSLTPISHTLEPGEVASFGIQGVFGPDERTPIAATTAAPYSMVVFLMAEWRDGSITTCSGFMLGPHTVGTAGHCVYDPDGLGWAKRVLAAPGANGSTKPFGSMWASDVHTVTGWSQRREVASDIGVLTLPQDIGGRTGLFQLRPLADGALTTGTYSVAGYPGDKSSASMWLSSGSIDRVSPSLLYFRFDVTHGNSGGPIWERTADGYNVVGLVEGGATTTNVAVRSSTAVVERFRGWAGGATDTPSTAPGSTPSLVTAPRTLTAAPTSLSAVNGHVAYAVVTVGATEGRGDLTLTTSGGSLLADTLLSPASCGGGSSGCSGVTGSGSARMVIPDAGNNLGAVVVTLGGTVVRETTVTVTARQGSESWQLAIPVQLRTDTTTTVATAPGLEATGRIISGSVPSSGGLALIVFGGGSGTQLLAASGCSASSAAFWAADGGAFVTYVPGTAIAAVNAAWDAKFPTGIPAGTALLARCR
ncbi:MAG: trypsin-like serine protease [Dehalococcoidia bacterium]